MALLCCVALSGFHGAAEYTWQCQDEEIDNRTPLLYTNNTGRYSCEVRYSSCEPIRRYFELTRECMYLHCN